MKTRYGFVSNSSTTSFFVDVKGFKTTIDLAEYLILSQLFHVIDYYEKEINQNLEWIKRGSNGNYPDESIQELHAQIKQKEERMEEARRAYHIRSNNLKTLSGDPNIAFPTPTAPTYIKKVLVNDLPYYYMATTNNIDFKLTYSDPPGLEKYCIWEGELNDTYIIGSTFRNLQTNKDVTPKEYWKSLDED
jgi:hypothetical protein